MQRLTGHIRFGHNMAFENGTEHVMYVVPRDLRREMGEVRKRGGFYQHQITAALRGLFAAPEPTEVEKLRAKLNDETDAEIRYAILKQIAVLTGKL